MPIQAPQIAAFGRTFNNAKSYLRKTMNIFEKAFALFAVAFAIGLITALLLVPGLRQMDFLIPACSLGFIINIGLMFIVLRDIFLRHFPDQNAKYLWLAMILFVWPSVIFYLLRYGLKPRSNR